jgi:hypothetical protein
VLVFFERGSEQVCERVREQFLLKGHEAEILPAPIAQTGYTLT